MGGTPVLCLTWGRSRIRAGNRNEVEKTWLLSCWALDSAHVSIPLLGFQFLSTDKAKADLTVRRAFSNLTFGGSVRTFCRQNAPPAPSAPSGKRLRKEGLMGPPKGLHHLGVHVFVCLCAYMSVPVRTRRTTSGVVLQEISTLPLGQCLSLNLELTN